MSTFWTAPLIALLSGTLLISLSLAYAISILKWRARARGHHLPPGPRRFPFIGILPFTDGRDIWKIQQELCATYGDIVYTPIFGRSIIILGGSRTVLHLLEKCAASTSDRPATPLAKLTGQDFNISLMGYDDRWRRHRRAFWQHFAPAATERLAPAQDAFARVFARRLLEDPTKLTEHIRYSFAATIIKIVYGFNIEATGDAYVAKIEQVVAGLEAFTPGKYLVDVLPVLRFVPSWVPGAGFQKTFSATRRLTSEIMEALWTRTKEGMASGETSHSVLADLLQRLKECDDGEAIANNVSLTAFEAGADTTFANLQIFFLAMSLYPDAQKKAQAELDLVVGPDRLPTHDDISKLPYINAVVKETLRWQNVVPISIPHQTSEDIIYDGYFIPSGTIIIPSTWNCLHDPTMYTEPTRFLPDRFMRDGQLDPNVRDPAKYAFGYGRRICPGKHFAQYSLFINIAIILHVFHISPALDEYGNPIHIEPKMKNSIISYPEDCRCTIKPRSETARRLILEE